MSLTYGIEMLKYLFSDIQINRDALGYKFLTFWVQIDILLRYLKVWFTSMIMFHLVSIILVTNLIVEQLSWSLK